MINFLKKNFGTTIAGLILCFLAGGYFYNKQIYDPLHIALIALLISALFGSVYLLFVHSDPDQVKGVLLLLLSGVNIVVQLFKNYLPDIFVLNYIVVAFSTAVLNFKFGLLNTLIILLLEISLWSFAPSFAELKLVLIHTGMNIVFVFVVGLYLYAEGREKEVIEKKYEDIIKEAESLDNPVQQDFDLGDLKMLSREQRQKRMLRLSMDLDDKIHKIMEVIKQSLHPFTAVIFLRVGNTNEFMVRDIISDTEEISVDKIDFSEGVFEWILTKKTSIYLSDLKGIFGIPYYKREPGIRTFLAVPVMKQSSQRVEGIVCVDSLEVQAFNEEHKKIITILGNQVMEAIEHSEILHQMLSEMTEFAAFYDVSRKLASSLNLADILFTTLDSARKIVRYSFGAITLFNSEGDTLTISSFIGEKKDELINKQFKPDGSLIGYILNTYNRTYLIGDASQKSSLLPLFGPKLTVPAYSSLLLIPLQIKGKNTGAMVFASESRYFFTPYEAEIFEVLGNQVSVAIDNARMYQQVEALAVTDGLTKLYNHRKFQEILDNEFRRAQRYNTPLTIMLIDIDRFKNINDTKGHPVGDEVLKRIAGIIKKFVRETDYPCRYGGEEFVLVLPNTTTKEAVTIAERIRKSVEKSTFIFENREELYITISIGIASFPSDAKEKQELVDKADKALYFSKESGRNQTQTYEGLKQLRIF